MNKNKAFFEGRGYSVDHLSPGSSCWIKSKGESYILIDGDGEYEGDLPPDNGPFRVGFYKECGDTQFFEVVNADQLVPTLEKVENMLENDFIPTSEFAGIERLAFIAVGAMSTTPRVYTKGEKVYVGDYSIRKGKVQVGIIEVDGHDQPQMEDGWIVDDQKGIDKDSYADPASAIKAIVRQLFTDEMNGRVDEYLNRQETEKQASEVF